MTSLQKPHLLFVVGATATGKSDLAVEICEAFRGSRPAEIINGDSVQFFEGVDIGAAKPSREMLGRAKHHLIGHLPLASTYTAGDFRRDALRVIEASETSSFVPVGGSGFYIQALEKGMYDVPSAPAEVREQLERRADNGELAVLHEELRARDPDAADKIQAADRYRIIRALEILLTQPEGETLTSIRERFERSRPESPFTVTKLGVFRPRDQLRDRVVQRTRKMLEAGLLEEVQALRSQNLHAWAPMQSVGYKEAQLFLDGKLARAELEPAIVTSTMQLAKRQMTWFKRDPEIHWFTLDEDWQKAITFGASDLTRYESLT